MKVKLIGKKKFVAVAFDPTYEVFIIYIAALNIDSNYKVDPLKKF